MQRHNTSSAISMLTAMPDQMLLKIKNKYANSYWANNQGVYVVQFDTGNQPLMNVPGIMRFQLIRYTPTYSFDAFSISIPGRMNNDGSIEYGGGILGMISKDGNKIIWSDGTEWLKVDKVIPPGTDALDIRAIDSQAYTDSIVMGDIQSRYYDIQPRNLDYRYRK